MQSKSVKWKKFLRDFYKSGENLFIKYWDNGNPQRRQSDSSYSIENLSFSYFISNLLDYITENTFDREWFRYPIQEGKEKYHIEDYFIKEE